MLVLITTAFGREAVVAKSERMAAFSLKLLKAAGPLSPTFETLALLELIHKSSRKR